MRFLECLNSGKKFRDKYWASPYLWIYVKDGILYNSTNRPVVTIANMDSDNWELVQSIEIGSLQHGTQVLYNCLIYTKVDVFSVSGGQLIGIQDNEKQVHIVNASLPVEVYHG